MLFFDTGLRTADDIKKHLGVPYLGVVTASAARNLRTPSLLLDPGVPDAFSDAMRAIRAAVVSSDCGSRTVMVTSTESGEGQTVVSTSLAHALAHGEERTLMIDSDMRRPRVHDAFEFALEPGLSDVLTGAVPVQEAIRTTANPFLSVLSAGSIPQNPAELLASPLYRRLVEELSKDYDWIVVDAPPGMAVTDAAVISGIVGGVVFVIGWATTSRRQARMGIDQLTAARARIVGAVLNHVKAVTQKRARAHRV